MTMARRIFHVPLEWTPGKTGEVCHLCRRARPKRGGPDPCLGKLPGDVNACCGHGVGWGYVTFANGKTLLFSARQAFQAIGPRRFDAASSDAWTARTGKKVTSAPLAAPPKKQRGTRHDG
jgi:hypothetical protein